MNVEIQRDDFLNALCEASCGNGYLAIDETFGLNLEKYSKDKSSFLFKVVNKEKLFWAIIKYNINYTFA